MHIHTYIYIYIYILRIYDLQHGDDEAGEPRAVVHEVPLLRGKP